MTDLPTQATLTGSLGPSSHKAARGTPPTCVCQKHQRISAAYTVRDRAGGDPALLTQGLVSELAAHLERYHPEIRGVQMAAEEAEYRGILGL